MMTKSIVGNDKQLVPVITITILFDINLKEMCIHMLVMKCLKRAVFEQEKYI